VARCLSERPLPASVKWNRPRYAVVIAAVAALVLLALLPRLPWSPTDAGIGFHVEEAPTGLRPSALAEVVPAVKATDSTLESGGPATEFTDPALRYRIWLAEMAEQVQRISADTPRPVEELASSWRPVATSISVAIGVLRQTLPGGRPQENDPGQTDALLGTT
jgi:hypothetical protein